MSENISPRPWSVQFSDIAVRPYVEDATGHPILFTTLVNGSADLRNAAACVNLLAGLDPACPRLAAALESHKKGVSNE